jgi:3-oxoadipate enol-lactonase
VVWGRRDPVVRAAVDGAAVRAAIPHAEYVELDTGHAPFVEEPDAFLDAVLPFLASLHAGPRAHAR